MLLLGPPGIGKTHFARKLAELLGTGMNLVPMSSMTAGWLLSGASSQWKGAKPGKVFEALVDGQYANPVIVVDEIDKASADAQYDPLGSLYGLLEHDTAGAFMDEFAAQCGFCTPGMIMAAKALLDHNPNPTREDVVDAISGNICRCTGYEPIIRAVLTAARSNSQNAA